METEKCLSMLRPELICLATLAFVQIYAYYYRRTTARIFRAACWAAIVHLIFDVVTVITVNNLAAVPASVNKICHYFMYISAVIFCQIYLDYIAAQIVSARSRTQISTFCRALIIIYLLLTPVMNVTYTENPITNYSGGAACYVVMGTAFLFFIFAIVLILFGHKKIEKYVFVTTLSTTLFMMVCVTVQLLIPTFLFTASGITVVTLGMFFAIENPAKYYQQRALVDISTGVKNKNCFIEDVKHLTNRREAHAELKISAVVCDLNWLKLTNDTYGHLEGDEQIRRTAQILSKHFQNTYSVYRFGGDEFVTLFLNKDDKVLQDEIAAIYRACEEAGAKTAAPFSLALGYATTEDAADIQEALSIADRRMYEEKERIKNIHPYKPKAK